VIAKRDVYDSAAMRFQLLLQITTGRVMLENGNLADRIVFGVNPPTSTWTHVTVVATASATTLYFDGILLDTAPALGTSSTANVAIGTNGQDPSGTASSLDTFNGALDEVRVYGRELTTTEVQQIHAL
jgi:hypothetical protein